jgi:predicted phosphoserine aminotransferase
MSDSVRNSTPHIKLYIPGPVEVRPKILDAQAHWMIGHRMPECLALMARVKPKLQQVFFTNQRVLILASTGSGFWEAASRNCVARKVLHCVSGAFAKRWVDVSVANGKEVEVLDVPWGQAVLPDQVVDRLKGGDFDALAIVHNETSTGVTNPIRDIAAAVRALPNGQDIIIMVDSVSGLSGAELRMDEWDLDVVITSGQKAFALPPGIAFCGVSERAMQKAATVKNRGWYFDFLTIAKDYDKDQTPSTTPVSLLYATDVQLEDMLAEGMEARFARHLAMRDATIEWVRSRGFDLYGDPAYASPTLTNIANPDGKLDIAALNKFLRSRGMIISNGYGTLKGKAFRIAHMGDLQMSDMQELFATIDEYLGV